MRGYYPYFDQSKENKVGTTLIRHAPQAARATFPLKKGEGMKGKAFITDTPARKISPLALLGRNEKEGGIFRDPFDCAEKTGLPKIAGDAEFFVNREQNAPRQAAGRNGMQNM